MRRRTVGLGAVAALAALTGTTISGVPASAALADAELAVHAWFSDNAPGCTRSGVAPGSMETTWSDDGVPVSRSTSQTGQHRNDTNAADVVDVSASGSVSVTSTPLGTGPGKVVITASAASSAVPRLGSSLCNESSESSAGVRGDITLTQPMWVTVTARGTGAGIGSGYVSFDVPDGEGGVQIGRRGTASNTFLASPGVLGFNATSTAWTASYGSSARSASFTGTYEVILQPLGAGTPVTGKGRGLTVLGSRDCATGAVAVDVTRKAKRKARLVTIELNGQRVARLKGKKLRRRSLLLPAAASSPAELVATIRLTNGRKVTVRRSYLACS